MGRLGGILVAAQWVGRAVGGIAGSGPARRRRVGRPGPHVEVAGPARAVEATAR